MEFSKLCSNEHTYVIGFQAKFVTFARFSINSSTRMYFEGNPLRVDTV